ncbi:MAG: 30S ribosomal protein S18 [Candidatus Omnitrophota bacterium]
MRGKLKIIRKKRFSLFAPRKKTCRFCTDKVKSLDYKEVKRLETFVNDRGKMVSSRLTGNCAKHQRMLVETIKKARFLSLLPYTR